MNVVTNLISRRGAMGLPKRTIQLLAISMAMIGLALGIAAPSQASPNIVVNGSFETGNFTGWTGQGNTGFQGVQCPGPGPTVADGNCSAFFGPVGSIGGIHQALNTAPGESYLIDFSFLPDGGTPSSFSASFGGVTLVSLTNPPGSSTFENFAFTEIASGPSTTLQFDFRDDPGFLFLDAVSVSAVPEPASLLLVGVGLGGVWLARRRRIRG